MRVADGARSTGVDQRTRLSGCAAVAETPVCWALPPRVLQPAACAEQAANNANANPYHLTIFQVYDVATRAAGIHRVTIDFVHGETGNSAKEAGETVDEETGLP